MYWVYPCFHRLRGTPCCLNFLTGLSHVCLYRDTGSVDVEKTVPDTITKWAAGAFCVSSVGFGVSPNTGLTAFQPFFVSLTLPYSVIRGEVFTLKATVFNYLSKCIMVNIQGLSDWVCLNWNWTKQFSNNWTFSLISCGILYISHIWYIVLSFFLPAGEGHTGWCRAVHLQELWRLSVQCVSVCRGE